VVRAPGLALAFPAAAHPRLVDGWYAPAYGTKLEAPVVSVVADDVADHEFHTLIAPLPRAADRAPVLRVLPAPAPGATMIEVAAASGKWRDLIAWSEAPASFELGPIRCHARAAWLREAADGQPASFVAFEARETGWSSTDAPLPLAGGPRGSALWRAGA
jgi:hypothetical protein